MGQKRSAKAQRRRRRSLTAELGRPVQWRHGAGGGQYPVLSEAERGMLAARDAQAEARIAAAEAARKAADPLHQLRLNATELDRYRADAERLVKLRTKATRTLHDVHGIPWSYLAADLGVSTAALVQAHQRTPPTPHTTRGRSRAMHTAVKANESAKLAREKITELVHERTNLVATLRTSGATWRELTDATGTTRAALVQRQP